MSIKLLKTLVAISEYGSFSAAAENVCISHAAVGQQMKRLEEIYDVRLFDRNEKSPRLNQLGLALIPKAKSVIHDYETIFEGLVGDAQFIGELTLGAIPSTIRELIPRSVKGLMKNYPDLFVRIVPGTTYNLFDQISYGTIDAALISKPERFDENLNWQAIVEEELVLLTSPEVKGNDPSKILSENPFIQQNRHTAAGVVIEQWLSQNKLQMHGVMMIDSIETLTYMVTHNLGVAIVPNLCAPDPIFAKLRKIPLGTAYIARELGILTRKDCSKSRIVDRLQKEIEKILQSYD
ncbi:LysR family transcriptional regulator [Cocleimonas flava]|uniref:DNA-binding transcriptional LysR family regulator n=1 Tax=Cocleimonas flava TaxID=634765 RepID=A0A4R1EVG3_9GAMM|nr:LysR family transcriptional regulator [Cocleimonas flava]TCJ83128.1 DNA-binding transcriptional LysR family regulator [Cocleimonas flava]